MSERLCESRPVPQNIFIGRVAEGYDLGSPEMWEPALLQATVSFLADAADGGAALEFGIGTGRVALPLSERGVDVHGIDISEDMIAQLRAKPAAQSIGATVGDFATTTVPRTFSLVYVVYNALSNLTTQAEQVECFQNAARHLLPGGRLVVEMWVPDLRRFPPGAVALPFEVSASHVGLDTIDVATQRGVSHHYFFNGDRAGQFDSPYRYTWPSEQDLMAQLAGLTLSERWADWERTPFTSESSNSISVWQRPL
jgi:SAM-dependent methyltransferase